MVSGGNCLRDVSGTTESLRIADCLTFCVGSGQGFEIIHGNLCGSCGISETFKAPWSSKLDAEVYCVLESAGEPKFERYGAFNKSEQECSLAKNIKSVSSCQNFFVILQSFR